MNYGVQGSASVWIFASALQSFCCWVHSKLGLKPLPEQVISVGFSFTFFQRCYQSSYPKGLRAISKAKREPQCLRHRITICYRKRAWNQEDLALHCVSVFEKKPESALRTRKQPARLDHLKKKSCSIPETWRQAQYYAAKGDHSWGTGLQKGEKRLSRSGCLSENN